MDKQELIKKLEEQARVLRRDIVEIVGVGLPGHIGGSCSSADIVTALYFYKMHLDPKNPKKVDRDRFLFSKGHAAIVQYAALAELGYFDKSELKKCKSLGSILQGHPDYRKTPGVEANTGSLGQGLSIGLGMALGLKLDDIDRKVYVIIGDGEIAEGQIWEAAMAASNFKADNLVAILDNNELQATGPIAERFNTNPLIPKWESFGWNVIEINGHDMGQIIDALDEADNVKGKPTIIVAHTIKGKGISFAENAVEYHNGALTQEAYEKALAELSC
ncbi:MAG: transketolase [Clostridiales bacterium]|nr:transketolase [Clostridiales bacterium]